MYAYCLFCQTQLTETAARLLSLRPDVTVISPKVVHRNRAQGSLTDHTDRLLPGYLFLYAEEPLRDFRGILRTDGAVRFLGSSDHGFQLAESDLRFAEFLYRAGGVIRAQKGIRINGRVRLLASADFSGIARRVLKFDRQREQALVEFAFDGNVHRLWVACDVEPEEKAGELTAAQLLGAEVTACLGRTEEEIERMLLEAAAGTGADSPHSERRTLAWESR